MDSRGLTLMELMVAVVIVGLMAAFAIPSYNKAVNKAEERQMTTNLRSIIAAQEVYKAKNGDYWPAGAAAVPTGNIGLPQLNSDLKLNIVANAKYAYSCNSAASQQFKCYATYAPNAFAWGLYTDTDIAHGSFPPNQVCCDKSTAIANPCPSLPSCP